MPKLNGTGPRGQGVMTGRGRGNCKGNFSCVQCPFYSQNLNKEERLKILKKEKEDIEKELISLEKN